MFFKDINDAWIYFGHLLYSDTPLFNSLVVLSSVLITL